MLTGVIASSPLVLQTFPASKILRFIGGKASAVLPNVLIDAPVAVEVRVRVRIWFFSSVSLGVDCMRSFSTHTIGIYGYSRCI